MTGSQRIPRYIKFALAVIATLILMLFPLMMKGQGAAIYGQALTSTGKPASYATVRVCPYSGSGLPCSPLAAIYSDPPITQVLPNPTTTDQFGNYSFFTAPGYYIVQLSISPGITYSYVVGLGGGGGTTTYFSPVGEIPVGLVNGTNRTFVLSGTPQTGSLLLAQNGVVLTNGIGYTLSGLTITFAVAPSSVDSLYANYFVSTTVSNSSIPASQIPTGAVNGVNRVFTLASTPKAGSLIFQLNGQVLTLGVGYQISGTNVVLAVAPNTGDVVYANYIH